LELGSDGAESGTVTGADPLGSDSGDRPHQNSSVAVDLKCLALNISLLIERFMAYDLGYVLELMKHLKSVAVCHVHQD